VRCVQRKYDNNPSDKPRQCDRQAVKEVQMIDRDPQTDWWFALCPQCLQEFKAIYEPNAEERWREREVQ
jgi:hypothetical protein